MRYDYMFYSLEIMCNLQMLRLQMLRLQFVFRKWRILGEFIFHYSIIVKLRSESVSVVLIIFLVGNCCESGSAIRRSFPHISELDCCWRCWGLGMSNLIITQPLWYIFTSNRLHMLFSTSSAFFISILYVWNIWNPTCCGLSVSDDTQHRLRQKMEGPKFQCNRDKRLLEWRSIRPWFSHDAICQVLV